MHISYLSSVDFFWDGTQFQSFFESLFGLPWMAVWLLFQYWSVQIPLYSPITNTKQRVQEKKPISWILPFLTVEKSEQNEQFSVNSTSQSTSVDTYVVIEIQLRGLGVKCIIQYLYLSAYYPTQAKSSSPNVLRWINVPVFISTPLRIELYFFPACLHFLALILQIVTVSLW